MNVILDFLEVILESSIFIGICFLIVIFIFWIHFANSFGKWVWIRHLSIKNVIKMLKFKRRMDKLNEMYDPVAWRLNNSTQLSSDLPLGYNILKYNWKNTPKLESEMIKGFENQNPSTNETEPQEQKAVVTSPQQSSDNLKSLNSSLGV